MADMSKADFIKHIKNAMADDRGADRKKMYFMLLKCFTDADVDMDGAINPVEFDQMIEAAAAHPRAHGLAPATEEIYKTPEDRLSGRKEMFKKMDGNNDGQISLDEWLGFCYEHVAEKNKGI